MNIKKDIMADVVKAYYLIEILKKYVFAEPKKFEKNNLLDLGCGNGAFVKGWSMQNMGKSIGVELSQFSVLSNAR